MIVYRRGAGGGGIHSRQDRRDSFGFVLSGCTEEWCCGLRWSGHGGNGRAWEVWIPSGLSYWIELERRMQMVSILHLGLVHAIPLPYQ